MMINAVPSYCVSLELLISESTGGQETECGGSADCPTRGSSVDCPGNRGKDLCEGASNANLRWYVLFIYCASTFMQVVLWNTWSPIATSVMFAFPTWHAQTIALLSNWGSITFILFIVPSCWVLNRKGIRTSFIIADGLCTLGSGIRCLPVPEEYFTLLIHCGAILCAIGGVMLGPAVVRLSSIWFPPNQRTSATGIGTACSQLGMAASYLVGPWIVSGPAKPCQNPDPQRQKIRCELQRLMLICFICEATLFVVMLLTFPDKPSTPPSRSSCISLKSKYCFSSSIMLLIRNADVTLLALAAAFCSGITGPWLSLLTIMFCHSGLNQAEIAKLGFWTVICSCLLGLSVSKVSDFCPRHLKTILFSFILYADVMFLWILLLTTCVIPFHKAYLLIAVMCGLATVWSTPAIFYEFGVELAYPIPEGIVAGFMMTINNCVSCFVYILLYLLPTTDVSWMNYALVISGFTSLVTLCFVSERYNRLFVDDDEC